jgi:hypothetical protein
MGNTTDTIKEGIKDAAGAVKNAAEKVKARAVRGVDTGSAPTRRGRSMPARGSTAPAAAPRSTTRSSEPRRGPDDRAHLIHPAPVIRPASTWAGRSTDRQEGSCDTTQEVPDDVVHISV